LDGFNGAPQQLILVNSTDEYDIPPQAVTFTDTGTTREATGVPFFRL